MEERKLSEKESLALITQMISTAKNSFVDTGIGPILWGIVITICSFVQVAEIHFQLELPFDIWLLSIIAIIPQVFISIKENRMQRTRGWTDQTLSYAWMSFGIGVFIINFISTMYSSQITPVLIEYQSLTGKPISHLIIWNYTTSYLLFLFGVPTLLSGAVRRFRSMLFGAILCWVSSVVCVYTNIKIDFLMMGICATASWLIPGIIIRRNYLKERKRNDV